MFLGRARTDVQIGLHDMYRCYNNLAIVIMIDTLTTSIITHPHLPRLHLQPYQRTLSHPPIPHRPLHSRKPFHPVQPPSLVPLSRLQVHYMALVLPLAMPFYLCLQAIGARYSMTRIWDPAIGDGGRDAIPPWDLLLTRSTDRVRLYVSTVPLLERRRTLSSGARSRPFTHD